jgi:L-lactate permease
MKIPYWILIAIVIVSSILLLTSIFGYYKNLRFKKQIEYVKSIKELIPADIEPQIEIRLTILFNTGVISFVLLICSSVILFLKIKKGEIGFHSSIH